MVVFPFAKINLGLHVVGKRADGYHDIESIMLPIPMYDALEIIVDPAVAAGQVVRTSSGIPVPGDPKDDICLKAVYRIADRHALPGLRMHLHKAIPIGAGLGGGSSDGAHALLLVNELLALGMDHTELLEHAGQLGSDPPFFLEQGPQLAQGRGERLRPVDLDLRGQWLWLINPGIHVSTAEVYRRCTVSGAPGRIERALADQRINALNNDLEPAVTEQYPVVAALVQQMKDRGAFHAAMSGSGSTVFGLFQEPPVRHAPAPSHREWLFQL